MSNRIWVFKDALTTGIVEREAEIREDGYAFVSPWSADVGPNEYALTLHEAMAQAELMRLRKLRSLKKQIVKLEARGPFISEGKN